MSLQRSLIIRKAFQRTYCLRKCPEERNLFSTTFKVNLFTICIIGGIIHNQYNRIEQNRKEFEEKLYKRLDQLEKKE